MTVFKSGVLVVGVVGLVFSNNFLLGELNFGGVEGSVGNGISEDRDSSTDFTLEDLEANRLLLTAWEGTEASSHLLNFLSEISLGAARGSAGEELLEEVGGTSGLESIVTGSCANVDSNRGGLCASLLSANSDAIGECRGLEGAVKLEGFRDLATGESSEAAHNGFLGELQVLLS